MSHWERLDNPDNDPVVDKINSWIDKRNAASERSGLFRAEEWSDKFAFSTWGPLPLQEGIELRLMDTYQTPEINWLPARNSGA